MILDVNPGSGAVELLDADVLTRFHVAVRGRPEGDLDGVDAAVRIAGAGRVAGAEVLVSIAWVRARRSSSGPPDWDKRFDEMVGFSARRGWVEDRMSSADDQDCGAVIPSLRVHCEWPAEPKFTVLDFTRTAHREGRFGVGFERYTAPGLVAYGGRGIKAMEGQAAVLRESERRYIPGSRYEIRHVLADGDLVAVHARLTLAGATDGHAIVDLYRVVGGLIVEWWRVDSSAGAAG